MNSYQQTIITDFNKGFIHKSLLMKFDKCPLACAFLVNGVSEKRDNTLAMQYGTEFHDMVEDFGKNFSIRYINETRDSTECRAVIASWLIAKKYRSELVMPFADFQVDRLLSLHLPTSNKWGWFIKDWPVYFKPLLLEYKFAVRDVEIREATIDVAGTIDEVIKLHTPAPGDSQYAVMEYKTSGSSDLRGVRKECVLYARSLNKKLSDNTMPAPLFNKIDYIGCFNPVNSKGSFSEKIQWQTEKALEGLILRFQQADHDINTAEQKTDLCYWCGYKYLCWDVSSCITEVEVTLYPNDIPPKRNFDDLID